MIDQVLLSQARAALEQRARRVEQLEFGHIVSKEFTFDKIHEGFGRGEIVGWVKNSLGDNVEQPTIYRITAGSQGAANRLRECYPAPGGDRTYNIARDNDVRSTRTIYVGSSHSIKTRMREHLHQASKSTYALHLGRWCPPGDDTITVEIQTLLGVPTQADVQDVEDALWISSQPMFGKFGSK